MLLHGFPEHWWQWNAIAPVIAANGYRVLCPDLRGAGWTAADDPRVERETRLRDLLALFDALHIDRAHRLPRHGRHHRDAADLPAPRAGTNGSATLRAAGLHEVQSEGAPGFPAPARVGLAPPGRLTARCLLRGVRRPARCREPVVEAHLAPMRRHDIDAAVRPLLRGMVLPEAMRMARGVYRRRRLTVPTLVVFGREDRPWAEEIGAVAAIGRYADRVLFAYVDDAAHITDDAPAAVADLAIDWFERAA